MCVFVTKLWTKASTKRLASQKNHGISEHPRGQDPTIAILVLQILLWLKATDGTQGCKNRWSGSLGGCGVSMHLSHLCGVASSECPGTAEIPKCLLRTFIEIAPQMRFHFIFLAFSLQSHTASSLPSLTLINPSLSLTQNTAEGR